MGRLWPFRWRRRGLKTTFGRNLHRGAFPVSETGLEHPEQKQTLTDPVVVRTFRDGSFAVECAFCEGKGAFPETVYGNEFTEPCPVCRGKGINVFRVDQEGVAKCRYCDGLGRGWTADGYFVGDVCSVCGGTGTVLLEPSEMKSEMLLLWDLMDAEIVNVAKSRFDTGHYADSVEAAFKCLNAAVKRIFKVRTGEELDGAALMNRAFSPKQPVICLGDLSTESGQNLQQGYMQMFAGSMIGIRNPKAHDNVTIDHKEAIHLLFVASHLMSKLGGQE
jgi:uncharacterized protein (TIGR02391 family)